MGERSCNVQFILWIFFMLPSFLSSINGKSKLQNKEEGGGGGGGGEEREAGRGARTLQ